MRLHELVEPYHADQMGGPLQSQIGRALAVHGQQCQGTPVAEGKQPFDELPLLGVGLCDEFHALRDEREEVRVVASG